jgi:hypothetical protein
VGRLTAETGVDGLAQLGVDAGAVSEVAKAARAHPAMGSTPGGPPAEEELAALLRTALDGEGRFGVGSSRADQ